MTRKITDLGPGVEDRYAVWARDPDRGNRYQVLAVGESLDKLRQEHGVTDDEVITITEAP